jgi:hypothetical protein
MNLTEEELDKLGQSLRQVLTIFEMLLKAWKGRRDFGNSRRKRTLQLKTSYLSPSAH